MAIVPQAARTVELETRMNNSTLAIPLHLNSDRFAIRHAVTAIRNSFMRVDGRPLLVLGGGERRASVRVAMRVPVRITAADIDQGEVHPRSGEGAVIEGVSQGISLGGLGLAHSSPVESDFAIVRFDLPPDEPVCLVVELVWSNRSENGSWMSGTRILGLIDPLAVN
jgi:hypothetical protein